jgi:GDPmannose 4,6-dehydratase
MYACNGILFNHESPLRGETFVTRKITRAIAAIVHKKQDCLYLGNLDAKRDWGHAKDYVEAMWLMLQQEAPDDFVVATGITTTIREFVQMAFAEVGIALDFQNSGIDEEAYIKSCKNPLFQLPIGQRVVAIDAKYFRPTEVELLIGKPDKIKEKLGWKPKYDLEKLCKEMVEADLKNINKI